MNVIICIYILSEMIFIQMYARSRSHKNRWNQNGKNWKNSTKNTIKDVLNFTLLIINEQNKI